MEENDIESGGYSVHVDRNENSILAFDCWAPACFAWNRKSNYPILFGVSYPVYDRNSFFTVKPKFTRKQINSITNGFPFIVRVTFMHIPIQLL